MVFSCWNGLIIEFWHFIWFFHLPLRLDYSWHLLEMHLHTRDQCLVPEVRGDGSVLARVDIDAHGSLNWPCGRRPDPMPNVYGELNEFEWFRIQVLEKNRKGYFWLWGEGSVLARVNIDAHGSLDWHCGRHPDTEWMFL